ncbi:Gfo/Idh/MocA family oxidoreductase [Saccharopolyspora sp. TS4A08]|uniref:Gfo/Idh/MocA family oxidoreductase n=1 Tax=Saccharopolyspora ipomoeae TaxID=3042027 RepID=A0ABT6PGP3_9PSEU|nr:Gfo/Idh/MocA family oxidoreductase [Saccharopolyspora sp. TS4A08]MDI2027168.1 Gfo/Idh/MocA family oxidoreductase [Saccharopolyspora sp. TS4A08]
MSDPTTVVLVGVHGHGRWHLRNVERMPDVRLVGICDPRPPEVDPGVPVEPDLAVLLEKTRPDVTIVCTPIHTHSELALLAARAGSHVLLEKPPTPTLAEFDELAASLASTGRACQIGFQSLGSHALRHARALLERGAIGELRGIGAAGAWRRGADYYARARWAGRRSLDGVPVVDGALTNPFAHAIANALALEGVSDDEELRELSVELYRANPIEADDTSCLRLVTARGVPIVVAVTLCADREVDPYVVLRGSRGRIVVDYRSDRVRLETPERVETTEHGATDLLENLIAHTRSGVPLLVPPATTRPFMRVLEAVRLAPDPVEIPSERDGDRHVVPGVSEDVVRAADSMQLLSEMDVPWLK